MINLSDEDRAKVLGSFSNIGTSKAVGYLPLNTISNILELNAEALAKEYADKGFCTRIFKIDECCIKSGALYIYSDPDLQAILNDWSETLMNNGWSIGTCEFIIQIAKLWLPETDPIFPVIQTAFGEYPLTKRD